MQVQSLSWEDLLEEGMATHSSILAWRIPWTEEPGGLQSVGSLTAGHDRAWHSTEGDCKCPWHVSICSWRWQLTLVSHVGRIPLTSLQQVVETAINWCALIIPFLKQAAPVHLHPLLPSGMWQKESKKKKNPNFFPKYKNFWYHTIHN